MGWLCFFLLLLLAGSECRADSPLVLKQVMKGENANNAIRYLEDQDHRYSLDQVRSHAVASQFSRLPNYNPNFGLSHASYWVQLDVFNPGTEPLQWYLEGMHPQWDEVTFYIEDMPALKIGDHRPFAQRQVEVETNIMQLTTLPGEVQRIWVHFSYGLSGVADTTLRLWTPKEFNRHYSDRMLAIGCFFGVGVLLFFYNLFVGFSTRMVDYIWYTSYVFSAVCCLLAFTGTGYKYLWSGWPWFADFAPVFFASMMLMLATHFTRRFLHVSEEFPLANRVMLAVIIMAMLAIVGELFGWREYAIRLLILCLSISIFYPFIGLRQYFHGRIEARFYVIAWSAWSLGILMALLRNIGVIPSNFVTSFASALGLFLEAVLLSFALADRYNKLQQHNDTMEQHQMEYLEREHERLEAMVNERTEALNLAREKAEILARTDMLTCVSNRRAFFEEGEREWQRSTRHQLALSLIMVDVDFFKSINDDYGHVGGDAALVALAKMFSKTVRKEDLVGRFGGEEFSILLPQTELSVAIALAERVRIAVETMQVEWEGEKMRVVTASFGVATARIENGGSDSFDALLNRADIALYQAKEMGRNRVCGSPNI